MYKCPYCNTNTYKEINKGSFSSWAAVQRHVPSCKKNSGEFFIDKNIGPIHYTELDGFYIRDLHIKFKKANAKLADIKKAFKRRNIIIEFKTIISKEDIINKIQLFYNKNGRIPQYRDWYGYKIEYVASSTVDKIFGSWNAAIEAAGFEPNEQNGFGINTYGKDGYLYRSRSEAIFSDKYLYKQYTYDIEPKYPEPYNKYYDWYVKELDLYIELDGELRPEVILEKININKELKRKLLIVKTADINKVCLNDYIGD